MIVWTVLVGAVLMVLVGVLIPRIGGAIPYTVLTGSMRPELTPGTLVVVKPVPVEDIGVGSVITYQLKSGEPAVVTHRVVGVTYANDEYLFRTQGDANESPDLEWVREVQLKGKLWYSVPKLGYVSQLLSSGQRDLVTYVGAAILIGYSAFMFTGAMRDRSRLKRANSKTEVEGEYGVQTESL